MQGNIFTSVCQEFCSQGDNFCPGGLVPGGVPAVGVPGDRGSGPGGGAPAVGGACSWGECLVLGGAWSWGCLVETPLDGYCCRQYAFLLIT